MSTPKIHIYKIFLLFPLQADNILPNQAGKSLTVGRETDIIIS